MPSLLIRRTSAPPCAVALLAVLLSACTDSSAPPDPGALSLVAVPAQGAAGSRLATPVVVKVADRGGRPMSGMHVSWSVTAGEGSVSAEQTQSDASGHASVQWTLGTRTGPQTLEARLASGTPLVITVVAETGPVARLELQPDSIRFVAIGDTVRIRAQAFDEWGNAAANPVFTYSVQPAGIATVDASGLVRSVAPGTATVSVGFGGRTSDALVRVQQQPVSIATARSVLAANAGDSVRVTAIVRDARGAPIADAEVVWSLIGPAVAWVSPDGWLRGITPGTTRMRVTSLANPALVAEADVHIGDRGAFNMSIEGLHITQATQTFDGAVPLIAGRDGFLRIFVRADGPNTAVPAVRVTFHGTDGSVIETRTIEAPQAAVPLGTNEGSLVSSWNVPLPGSLIQPGLRISAQLDPDNRFVESDEGDNFFPVNGAPLTLDVRTAAPFRARLVPVVQSGNGLIGDVTTENRESYMSVTRAVYPLSSYDVDVRAPYNFTGVIPSQYDTAWSRLLLEIRVLRTADASDRYYYGVLKPAYTSGGTGLGYVGVPAAIGVDWPQWRAYTAAHEWGHNFGRQHVLCGNPPPANPDLAYPYANGRIGVTGYDLFTGQLKAATSFADLMSYCVPNFWISDYTYTAVMNFRASAGGPVGSSGGPQRALLVWGRIGPDGPVLEPAFEVVTRPSLPARAGPHRLEAVDDDGRRLFELAFDGAAIDHIEGEQHFAFAVPLDGMPTERVAVLRLRAQGRQTELRRTPPARPGAAREVNVSRGAAGRVRLDWDARDTRAVLVRDAATGSVLAIARGGAAEIVAPGADVDIITSDGVAGTTKRVRVPPR